MLADPWPSGAEATLAEAQAAAERAAEALAAAPDFGVPAAADFGAPVDYDIGYASERIGR